jgi:dTDP-4-dehydrorhamnose reductase
MLGRALNELIEAEALPRISLGRRDFDFEQPNFSRLEFEPGDVVFNAAAYTAVDLAESEPDRAETINATTPELIAQLATRRGAKLVQVSTDYVFDGEASSPYLPGDRRSPKCVYGRTKARCEELVLKAQPEALVVRTSWVFAPWGKNFALTMASLLKSRAEVKVVQDQVGCPTFAPDLAAGLLGLAQRGARGIYHFANGPPVSWYEFAVQIQAAQGSTANIIPVNSSEFPRPAVRPKYSVLDTSSTVRLLGPVPDFRSRLALCVATANSS